MAKHGVRSRELESPLLVIVRAPLVAVSADEGECKVGVVDGSGGANWLELGPGLVVELWEGVAGGNAEAGDDRVGIFPGYEKEVLGHATTERNACPTSPWTNL